MSPACAWAHRSDPCGPWVRPGPQLRARGQVCQCRSPAAVLRLRVASRSEANEASGGALRFGLSARLNSTPGVGRSLPSRERLRLGRCRRRSALRDGSSGWGVAVGLFLLMIVVTGCGPSASQRQGAIDSFEPPDDWEELTSPIMSGEFRQGLCIGPIDCQVSLVVQWRVPERPSPALLQATAQAAGWERIEFVEPCDDTSRYCSLGAKRGSVSLSLSYRPPQLDGLASWVVRLAAE